jgi:hypothetical protein
MGGRPVLGMSLRSLPKTIRPSHGSKAPRLRPSGSQWKQINRYFATDRKRSYSLLCHVLNAVLCVIKSRNAVAHVARRVCPVAGRSLLLSAVARRGTCPVHLGYYLSCRLAPSRSARRTKCADHGVRSQFLLRRWAGSALMLRALV